MTESRRRPSSRGRAGVVAWLLFTPCLLVQGCGRGDGEAPILRLVADVPLPGSRLTVRLPEFRCGGGTGASDERVSVIYIWVKFFHIWIAILALGASAGLGIVLEFYGDHPTHGPFLLRAIKRIVTFFVLPGYVLVLVTGLWMVNLSWPLATRWIQAALVLWGIGIVVLTLFLAVLRRQLALFETKGSASIPYKRVSLFGRALGAGLGLVVILILYLMVFKPGI